MAEEQAQDGEVEHWIVQTQTMLGSIISKPRLLADRLRKPPFRFLFDIASEIARQTGFGLHELFGGALSAKADAPNSREEKVAFLERWIAAVAAKLEAQAGDLAHVSAHHVICGTYPEWTNFLLQCTAAAASVQMQSTQASAQAKPQELHPEPQSTQQESAARPEEAAVSPAPEQISAAPSQPQAEPSRVADPAPELLHSLHSPPLKEEGELPGEVPREVLESPTRALAPIPVITIQMPEPTAEEIEQAKQKASELNWSTALQEFDAMHEEFSKTAGSWHKSLPSSGVPSPMAARESPTSLSEEASQSEEGFASPATTSTAPLKNAAQVRQKVDEELQKAQDLLASIEGALDQRDAEVQRRRAEEVEHKAALNAEAQAKVQAEAAAAAEAERLRLEKEQQKRTKKDAVKARKEALEAEGAERLAAAALAAKFPMSKTSQLQGARMVSCVGGEGEEEEEYEWDGEDADHKKEAQKQERKDSKGEGDQEPQGPLFDRLRAELRETFVSYLCASMPEALLKKYDPDEVVGCLQTLLKELRSYLMENSLEDVQEETSPALAEELQEQFKGEWLSYLQGTSSWALRQKYVPAELLDTLQALCQTCFERLTDELGPTSRWAKEGSCLLPPPLPPDPAPAAERAVSPAPRPDSRAAEAQPVPQRSSSRSPGPWQSSLRAAPWEEASHSTLAGAAQSTFAMTNGGMQTGSGFRPVTGSARPVTSGPPVFDASLGPALWEKHVPQGTAGQKLAPSTAMGARIPTGLRAR